MELTESDIKVNALVWYDERKRQQVGIHPGVITKVDLQERTFHVLVLDHYLSQEKVYPIDTDSTTSKSRTMLVLASSAEVTEYLDKMLDASMRRRIKRCREDLNEAKDRLDSFRKSREKLPEGIRTIRQFYT